MRYLQTDYLNQIAVAEPRLKILKDFSTILESDILVLEETDLSLLDDYDVSFNLVVMTEDDAPRKSRYKNHKILRHVYKYDSRDRLIAKIFGERHSIVFITSTYFSESLDRQLDSLVTGKYIDNLDLDRESGNLLRPDEFLVEGRHSFFSGLADLFDPPTLIIKDIIMQQSENESVDVLAYPLKNPMERELLLAADLVVVATRKTDQKILEYIQTIHSNIIPVTDFKRRNIAKIRKEILSRKVMHEIR